MERIGMMKRIMALFFMGGLLAFPIQMGYSKSLAEWLIKPGGSPPVITNSYASEELHHGDIWKIYLEAHDADGDMQHFVCIFEQLGYGQYFPDRVVIRKRHWEELRGYLRFFSSGGHGTTLPEWTRVNVTIFIRDKGGNASNKVALPLVLSRGAKQGPPPAPFDTGPLDRLGTIAVELRDPGRDKSSEPIFWWWK